MRWFLPDLIEASIATGVVEGVEDDIAWLEERGRTLDRASAVAGGARSRALWAETLGDLEAAELELNQALRAHDQAPSPYERARTLLILGRIRRRSGHKRIAREVLDQASAIFADLGAILWVERVQEERGHITGRRPSQGRLTDAERRIAALAADGFRNQEIADRLHMSVRTVEGHLSDVYGKLQIRSRTDLATSLDDLDDEA